MVENDNLSQAVRVGGRVVAMLDEEGAKLLLADGASTISSDRDGRANIPTAFSLRRETLQVGGLADFGGASGAQNLPLIRVGTRDYVPELG